MDDDKKNQSGGQVRARRKMRVDHKMGAGGTLLVTPGVAGKQRFPRKRKVHEFGDSPWKTRTDENPTGNRRLAALRFWFGSLPDDLL